MTKMKRIFRPRTELKRALEDVEHYRKAYLKAEDDVREVEEERDTLAAANEDLKAQNEALAAEIHTIKAKPRRRQKTPVADMIAEATVEAVAELKGDDGDDPAKVTRLG